MVSILLAPEIPQGRFYSAFGGAFGPSPTTTQHYLNWFAREGFPKGELGRLIALMHEIDHNGLGDLLAPLRARQRPPG